MRILFIGDVVGRSGREALAKNLPIAREKLRPDVVIVNGENSAHGFGLTVDIVKEIYTLGADVITTGNHVWDQREIIPYIDRDPKLLRVVNLPQGVPGKGFYVHTTERGQKILVIHAMARLFMDALDDPFLAIDGILSSYKMGGMVHAVFVDFHGEATSEKMAMAHYLDGRVSAVVGTHTHIPTADLQILPGGTAYQTDAGMTGDYNSVIGFKKDIPIQRFVRKMPTERLSPAEDEGTMCGTFIETDTKTGLALRAASVRMGPRLKEEFPDW
jgi:metallophosphoesterase (TIGR00282 family)